MTSIITTTSGLVAVPVPDVTLLCLTVGLSSLSSLATGATILSRHLAPSQPPSSSSLLAAAAHTFGRTAAAVWRAAAASFSSPSPSSASLPSPITAATAAAASSCDDVLVAYVGADAAASACGAALCVVAAVAAYMAVRGGRTRRRGRRPRPRRWECVWSWLGFGCGGGDEEAAAAAGRWCERAAIGAACAAVVKILLASAVSLSLFSVRDGGCRSSSSGPLWMAAAFNVCFQVSICMALAGHATTRAFSASPTAAIAGASSMEMLWIVILGAHNLAITVTTAAALTGARQGGQLAGRPGIDDAWSSSSSSSACERRTLGFLLGEFTAGSASTVLLFVGGAAAVAEWACRRRLSWWCDPRPLRLWSGFAFVFLLQGLSMIIGAVALGRSDASCDELGNGTFRFADLLFKTRCGMNLIVAAFFLLDWTVPADDASDDGDCDGGDGTKTGVDGAGG
ncbi:hypothetical protein DFJ73DRAFT_964993, partial [Zopfochytrium polystomum]